MIASQGLKLFFHNVLTKKPRKKEAPDFRPELPGPNDMFTHPCVGSHINATGLTTSFNWTKLNRLGRLANIANIFPTDSSFSYVETKLQVLNVIIQLSQTAVPSSFE